MDCLVVGVTVSDCLVGVTMVSRSTVRTMLAYCCLMERWQVNFRHRTPSQTARQQRRESESRSENAESRLSLFRLSSLSKTRTPTGLSLETHDVDKNEAPTSVISLAPAGALRQREWTA